MVVTGVGWQGRNLLEACSMMTFGMRYIVFEKLTTVVISVVGNKAAVIVHGNSW